MIEKAHYDAWNNKKKALWVATPKVLFKEADIWWCSVGLNLGNESMGKGEAFSRPVLVLRKLSHESCIVLPLTTKPKIGTWYAQITLHNEPRWVMLHQIRMMHIKRFQRRLSALNQDDFSHVKQKLDALLELRDHHPAERGSVGNPKSTYKFKNKFL